MMRSSSEYAGVTPSATPFLELPCHETRSEICLLHRGESRGLHDYYGAIAPAVR
jgi:hypothetical protein